MLAVGFRLTMLVAMRTTEVCKIAAAVAFPACSPDVSMSTRINWEQWRVVKRGCPVRRRVAALAIRRILIGLMIRVGGTVIVREVTVIADRSQPVVNAVGVALIARRLDMRTRQRERGVVVVEVGIPVRRRMTCLTLS